jgi:hypothetical protein
MGFAISAAVASLEVNTDGDAVDYGLIFNSPLKVITSSSHYVNQ